MVLEITLKTDFFKTMFPLVGMQQSKVQLTPLAGSPLGFSATP